MKRYHGTVRTLTSPRGLVSTCVLAYTLGLRHALDADHISAIDLMTRRLIADKQRPVTVGTFFSLGHSTIVIVTSIVVAATANAISDRFDSFSTIGGIIGTSVSAGVLILLGLINAWILFKLVKQMRKLLRHEPTEFGDAADGQDMKFHGAGCMMWLMRGVLKTIDRPWKMYPLGVLFGLGFDTSSEVALLGIASIEGSKGTSIWLILIFPILFTGESVRLCDTHGPDLGAAGMCLLDTIDGALMLSLYTSTSLAKDPIAIMYYSIVLTVITIMVAIVIGTIQLLNIVLNVASPEGPFWDGVAAAGDHFDIIGGAICASFLVFGGLSVIFYKPWRRRMESRPGLLSEEVPEEPEVEAESGPSAHAVPALAGPSKKSASAREELLSSTNEEA